MSKRELAEIIAEMSAVPVADLSVAGVIDLLRRGIEDLTPLVLAGVDLVADFAGDEIPRADRYQTVGDAPPALELPLDAGGHHLGAVHLCGRVGSDAPLDDPGDDVRLLLGVAATRLGDLQSHAWVRTSLEQARQLSLHDPLTGLPNRALLLDRLDHALRRARRSTHLVAIFFADLDRFKRVNDLYGHGVGDELLVAFADRLRSVLRRGDTAARLSGDEFVVLCEDLRTEAEADIVGGRLATALAVPFELSTGAITMSASIGIAFAGRSEHGAGELLEEADAAMYQAKRRGGARLQVLDLHERREARHRAGLEQELHGALARGELHPSYHPVVRTADGRLTGMEALLRWVTPQRGPVPPSVWTPLAEQSGLIADIGRWVLERACADRREWPALDGSQLELSVNISAQQLMTADFVSTVSSVLRSTGTDPGALTLEITEDAFLQDSDRALIVLRKLKRLGVMLGLDNFGTGYSSLGHLRRFPFDVVKIDRRFIADLGHDPASHAIVYTVAELAHLLGMVVVADGVETAEQRREVTMLGCDYSQGSYFSSPLSADGVAGAVLGPPTDASERLRQT